MSTTVGTAPVASTTTTTTTAATSTSSVASTTDAAPAYDAHIVEIDAEVGLRMSNSWRPGCPVELADLRLIELRHWNFNGEVTNGELVVAAAAADDIVEVFRVLFDAGFPIERMELIDVYSGDDDASMAANNTSAFNCREVAWRPGVWSNHAYGTAIDINPLVNPYVGRGEILPPAGAAFADRSIPTVGGIYDGDVVVRAFAEIGWEWGGYWANAADYQHFDKR